MIASLRFSNSFLLFFVIVAATGCNGQVDFASIKGLSAKAADNGTTPGGSGYDEDGSPGSGQGGAGEARDESSGNWALSNNCSDFLSKGELAGSATANSLIQNISDNIVAPPSIHVEARSISGQLEIPATQTANLANISGPIFIKALVSAHFENTSGDICARVPTIDRLRAYSGNIQLHTEHVADLSTGSGNLDLYGGTVDLLQNSSGDVCLYRGARIIKVLNVSSHIRICD